MNPYLRNIIRSPDFWIEWASTFVLIIGVFLTSWQIIPLNLWVSLLANIMWIYLGLKWRRWSLVTISIVISCLFCAGILKFYKIFL